MEGMRRRVYGMMFGHVRVVQAIPCPVWLLSVDAVRTSIVRFVVGLYDYVNVVPCLFAG